MALPFDPAEAWRSRDRWYVRGWIGGQPMRGVVELVDGRPVIAMGPSWCRDPRVAGGTVHEIVLEPEGPQLEDVPAELRRELAADDTARHAFESLATFYRKAFVRPIADAIKSETRVRRSAAVMSALRDGRREARPIR